MRLTMLLLIAAVAAGCGSAYDQGVRICNGNRVIPPEATYSSDGSVVIHSKLGGPTDCGRVFARNVLAATERVVHGRVTGIHCTQIDQTPSCYARTERGECLTVHAQLSTQVEVGPLPYEFRKLDKIFCQHGLP